MSWEEIARAMRWEGTRLEFERIYGPIENFRLLRIEFADPKEASFVRKEPTSIRLG